MPANFSPAKSVAMCSPLLMANRLALCRVIRGHLGNEMAAGAGWRTGMKASRLALPTTGSLTYSLNGTDDSCPTTESVGGRRRAEIRLLG
jgi:hypothetical protein